MCYIFQVKAAIKAKENQDENPRDNLVRLDTACT